MPSERTRINLRNQADHGLSTIPPTESEDQWDWKDAKANMSLYFARVIIRASGVTKSARIETIDSLVGAW